MLTLMQCCGFKRQAGIHCRVLMLVCPALLAVVLIFPPSIARAQGIRDEQILLFIF